MELSWSHLFDVPMVTFYDKLHTQFHFHLVFLRQKALILRNQAVYDRNKCLLYDAVSRNLARFRYRELVTNLGKTLLSTAKSSLCHQRSWVEGKGKCKGATWALQYRALTFFYTISTLE